jgi:methyltransferase-like protein/SAM-dependent methyltransferase
MTVASDAVPAPVPATSYDAFPYLVQAFPQTHPVRLGAVASLNGIAAPACDNARILELGCAAGGNLIPMAEAMPNSRFVGVDLSSRQINDGRAVVEELKLGNIELLHKDILDITPELGTFDYIICHGVYSWVPPKVADKILEICRENLSADGVAYVSYNIHPGWRLRGVVRDIMCYHTRKIDEPVRRITEARKLLNSLADIIPTEHTYGLLLATEARALRSVPDSQVIHDQLEDQNLPCYFHEFVAQAEAHELNYVCDAEPRLILAADMPANLRALLPPMTEYLEREQYTDFIRGASFRRSLLCHARQTPNRTWTAAGMQGMYLTSGLRPATPKGDSFLGLKGMRVSVSSPLANRLLLELTQLAPQRMKFEDLVQRGLTLAAGDPAVAARDKTLAICSANLAENGVAYVSYNTNPGWGLRSMIREMMRYHTRSLSDPEKIVKESRAVLDFLARSVPASRAHYAAMLKDEIDLIKNATDSYLFHDYHEPDNHAVFFHEFVDHAAAHDLQYLSEAEPRSTLALDLPADARSRISKLSSAIEREQYIDFLRYRGFRQTLLCHKNVAVNAVPDPIVLRGLYASSPVKPAGAVDPAANAPSQFVDPKGTRFTLADPLVKSIVVLLSRVAPARFLVDDLIDQAQQMAGIAAPLPSSDAAGIIFDIYLSGMVELHPRQVEFINFISERPSARPLARLQARRFDRAANLLHAAIPLGPTARAILPLLDGQHTREQLQDELQRLLDADQLEDARPLRSLSRDKQQEELAKGVAVTLQQLAAMAYLVA